jgi:hypothetical protein
MRTLSARTPALAMALLLAGCHQPSFDERYGEAEKAVRDKADAIDKELADRERAQASAAPAPAVSAPPSTAR